MLSDLVVVSHLKFFQLDRKALLLPDITRTKRPSMLQSDMKMMRQCSIPHRVKTMGISFLRTEQNLCSFLSRQASLID
jgi:hypothetical protein